LLSTIKTLLSYRPPHIKVWLDGALWYEGKTYLAAVANGRFFGHNMMIAPDASISDGQFDVVVVEGMPRLEVIRALQTTYSGAHIKRPDVHVGRAKVVEISGSERLVGEKDGEGVTGKWAHFELLPGALDILAAPGLP
jgi:diacylglycerol kinase family enzyme